MTTQYARRWICLAFLGWGLVGCNYFQGAGSDLDDEFADLELDDSPSITGGIPKKLSALNSEPADDVREDSGARLVVGDRFPLIKTIEQKLTQPGPQGLVTGHSRLETQLSLMVEEVRDGKIRFGVRYHGVRYSEQDLAGRRVEYNSAQSAGEIPPQVSAYAALVNNGFSFWVGPDNRLIELVGFPDFIKRCVQHISPAQRQAVVAQLSADRGDNGIASFVDDSIGILPADAPEGSAAVAVRQGASWVLPVRRIDGPAPMQVSTHCLIKSLTDETVQIDLFGTIMPVANTDSNNGWNVSVRGGRCLGGCTLNRQTGLPTESRMERHLDLVLQSPDGQQLEQQKEIVTTIRAVPGAERTISGMTSSILPAQHAELSRDPGGEIAPAPPGQESRRSPDDLRFFR